MKKNILFLTLATLILLTSCSLSDIKKSDKLEEKILMDSNYNAITEEIVSSSYKELDELPQEYSLDLAKENGDVITTSFNSYNTEKLETFIENFENKKSDMVRVTVYTKEGAAIIYDLTTVNGSIKLIRDNTRDEYSTKESRTRMEYNVVDILEEEKNNSIYYIAKLDNGTEKLLFFIIDK